MRFGIIFGLVALFVSTVVSLTARKCIVSGAAGRTGSLVFKKLLETDGFSPIGIIRTLNSGKKLSKKFKLPTGQLIEADITDTNALEKAITESGADSYIMCTSAVPKPKLWSLLKILILKLFRRSARPEFYFRKNQDPYNVDWLGAKNQIDAAKRAGIKHFVFLSSMGGSQPENFLNTIGRVAGNDLSGNILLWKRKAEKYLIESGMKYTILHPGGLIDSKGGMREIVSGINDELLKEKVRSIPRFVPYICTTPHSSERFSSNIKSKHISIQYLLSETHKLFLI